ncbi:MAG: hypothetical protein GX786_04005 [Clostridiales bacterium]|nr:hypothetical protein [Clostridiales bacterium]
MSFSARLEKAQRASVIIRRHEGLGTSWIDDAIVAAYIHEISQKLDAGKISNGYANVLRRGAEQFMQFVKTGKVKLLFYS